MKKFWWAILLVVAASWAFQARAEGSAVGVEGNLSFWWIINEQVENGVLEPGTGDKAAQTASGFNFKQGRLGFHFTSSDGKVKVLVRLRLEERADLLDFWGGYLPQPWFNLYVGQMKIPSTAEVLQEDPLTDFITRSTFGQNVGDYSLARTPYTSSFLATKSNNRDLGVAVKGALPDQDQPRFTYFLMISNGLGGGNYIGGRESPGYLYTNEFGDYYYGLRLEYRPLEGVMLGGHYSANQHKNAILQDKKTVVDLDHTVWTADFQVEAPWGLRVAGFYGKGRMKDFWNSQYFFFDYRGWGVWAIQSLMNGTLELGVRYDTFITEFQRDDNLTAQNHWTYGLNWRAAPALRLQLNYKTKDTANDFVPDVDDDVLYLNVEYLFESALHP